jgi:RNA polymerase sigma factor (sigma-70 family)
MKNVNKRVTFPVFTVLMSKTDAFLDENKLVRSLAKGEPSAFQDVYKTCFPVVTRSLKNMSAALFEAEDVFHASLLVLYEKSKEPDFVLSCKISTFLVAVARKKWLKQLEKEKRLGEKEIEYARMHKDEKADALFDIKKVNEQENKLKKLNEALYLLGSPCNELIKAFYINGKSMKEIANMFNYTNANNAKTQKHKCLQRLKKIFLK